jgi:iduronate 2-sulfatase
MARVALAVLLLRLPVFAQDACTKGLQFPDAVDLAVITPPPITGEMYAQACGWACHANPNCTSFTYEAASTACAGSNGCCHLKSGGSWLNSTVDDTVCGAVMRHPPSTFPPEPTPVAPPAGAKNVLHIIVDDLRPDLAPFGPAFMSTPGLSAFATTATLFSRTYCNIAVCSPSRMSFLTGRRPATSQIFNFINHFRQANCGELPGVRFAATPSYLTIAINFGGAGQCCSHCQADSNCKAWTLSDGGSLCHLHSTVGALEAAAGFVSGQRGTSRTREWTSLPQTFFNNGYNVYGTGKVFHTEEGGNGPFPWDGMGMPPLQDPVSWTRSPSATMGDVNAMAPMQACAKEGCGEPGDADGNPLNDTRPFEDKVIGDEAVALLGQLAAAHTPFYLAVGFRKPHLPHRHPSFYDVFYNASDLATAKYPVMDPSVPAIAFYQTGMAEGGPYVSVPKAEAQLERRNYYAATSWVDHQVKVVLDALDASGAANNTLVVFHADHGWSLGEYAQWEKFTLWEHGTRVPLLIRAPWLGAAAAGVKRDTPVELIDVMPTILELAGVPLPAGESLDGQSLASLMAGGPPPPRNYSLSVYPRCPANTTAVSEMWKSNACLFVERSLFFSMGVSIRTPEYRYTEWLRWNMTEPEWHSPLIGAELYSHLGDDGTTFDGAFEVVNLADDPAYAAQRATLSALLRAAY